MKLPRRNLLYLAASAAALPAVSRVARAQTYPSRPVRIIVGFPATDGLTRGRVGEFERICSFERRRSALMCRRRYSRVVVGRIFKADAAPVGMPWMWTTLFDYRWPTHGFAASRETAMAAFAKSWRREGPKSATGVLATISVK